MSDPDAMTEQEVEYWTNSRINADDSSPLDSSELPSVVYHNHGRGGHLEWYYIIMACFAGILTAGGLMYSIFKMVQNVAFDSLTEEDIFDGLADDTDNSTGLIDSEDGRCAICSKDTKGNEWQKAGVGGCGYLSCNECYVGYEPLKRRCEMCGQFLCYRRGRVTFIELMKEEEEGGNDNVPDTMSNDPTKFKNKISDMGSDEGLRRRSRSERSGR
jgi:hypothetical protein